MGYSLNFGGGRSLSAAQIIAALNPENALHAAHIEAVRQLEEKGMRYSNQDFDVLSAAHRMIGLEREPAEFEKGWVARMIEEAQARA